MATQPVVVGTPKVGLVQIAPADASAQKALVTPGSSGSKVTSIMLTSTDTSARVVQISIKRSSVNYILGSVNVAANAGTDGTTPAQPGFSPSLLPNLAVDNDSNPYIFLQSGDELDISSTTTVTSGKLISATAIYGDF